MEFSVIFDMDGTLLDTQRICIPAWDYAGALQGFSCVGSHIPNVCGMNEAGWTAYLENNFSEMDIPHFKEDMRSYIKENLVIKFKPGAQELIDFLNANSIKMAVASGSKLKEVKSNLEKLNAIDFFDALTGGDDVENGKPAPDIFLNAAKMLDVEPEACYVFEDSANGIMAAYQAGMKCIGVPDIVGFNNDIKRLMYAEITDLFQGIDIFKKLI